jgi:putative oxidoreductase
MAVLTRKATPDGHPVIEHTPHKKLLWPHAPNVTLAALRIVAGVLFAVHGASKLFGGIMVAMGLLTRLVAFFLSGEMAVAYFTAHFPRNFWPTENGGEPAALFCFIFLMFAGMGAGRFSVDEMISHARRPRTLVE